MGIPINVVYNLALETTVKKENDERIYRQVGSGSKNN